MLSFPLVIFGCVRRLCFLSAFLDHGKHISLPFSDVYSSHTFKKMFYTLIFFTNNLHIANGLSFHIRYPITTEVFCVSICCTNFTNELSIELTLEPKFTVPS